MRTLILLLSWLLVAPAAAQAPTYDDSVSPFAATPEAVVTAMLKLAQVGPSDVVADLGSGDGRMVIIAATEFGARGYGVDIDPKLVAYATGKAAEAGVSERARFFHRDLFATDVRDATVVTIYLLPGIMGRVGAKLRAELRPGARIVTHDYPLPGWPVDRVAVVDAPEKNDTTGMRQATLYRYTVPAGR